MESLIIESRYADFKL